MADEATDGEVVFAGVEGFEEIAGAFPFGLVLGVAGLEATGVTREGGVLLGGGMGFPGFAPTVGHRGGVSGGDGGAVVKDGVDGFEDRGGGTPGGRELLCLNGGVVLRGDFMEEAVVAAAPEVEALLGVAHVEEGAFAGGVLHDFVDKVLHDGPLGTAGVLKFVKEPMVEAGVETELEEEAGGGVAMGEEGTAGLGTEEAGEVGEAEATGAADALVVVAVIGFEDAVDAAGVLEGALEVVCEDGVETGEEGAVEGGADLEGFGAAGFDAAGTAFEGGEDFEGVGEEGVHVLLCGVVGDLLGGFFKEPESAVAETRFILGSAAERGCQFRPCGGFASFNGERTS